MGKKDILIANDKIIAIEDNLSEFENKYVKIIDVDNKIVTPGLIDQHIHVMGAGGKEGFASMTPEVNLSELIACGTTTVCSLLGNRRYSKKHQNFICKSKRLKSRRNFSIYV